MRCVIFPRTKREGPLPEIVKAGMLEIMQLRLGRS
jgi:hypothetical protein